MVDIPRGTEGCSMRASGERGNRAGGNEDESGTLWKEIWLRQQMGVWVLTLVEATWH